MSNEPAASPGPAAMDLDTEPANAPAATVIEPATTTEAPAPVAPVLVRELADGARTSLRNNSFPFKQDRLGRPQNIFASVYICR